MRKRRERLLKDLYDVTERTVLGEITPVPKGSPCIQGPINVSDDAFGRTNLASTGEDICLNEKRCDILNKGFNSSESGTCNVCSAPCSSCLHLNRAVSVIGSNAEVGHSDNKVKGKEIDNCSYTCVNILRNCRRTVCDEQYATNETSNLLSTSSNHDSHCEKAKIKSSQKASNTCGMSEVVEMCPSVSASYTCGEDRKQLLECNLQNGSRITDVRCSSVVNDELNQYVDKRNVALVSALRKQSLDECTEEAAIIISNDVDGDHACGIDTVRCGSDESAGHILQEDLACKYLLTHSSSHHRVEPPELSVKSMESFDEHIGPDNVSERKYVVSLEKGDIQRGPRECSLGSCKQNAACLETENNLDKNPPDVTVKFTTDEGAENSSSTVKSAIAKETIDNFGCFLEVPDGGVSEILPLLSPKEEKSESDVEQDVQVCDICGDVGKVECLVMCSRCTDGAEHIYCMQIMLDKVPEGSWLCEDCKMDMERGEHIIKKENVRALIDKVEDEAGNLKAMSIIEKGQNVRSACPKYFPKIEARTMVPEKRSIDKDLQLPKLGSKRSSEYLESSIHTKKSPESVTVPEKASPRKKLVFSRESSFNNMDVGKAKHVSLSQPCVNQSTDNSQAFVRSQTFSCSVPSRHKLPQASRGASLLKSYSFNNSIVKGKLTELIESIPKNKIMRNSALVDRRKAALPITTGTSSSFKTSGIVMSNTESVSEYSTIISSVMVDDLKGMKQMREKSILDGKNPLFVDNPVVSLATATGPVNPFPMMEQKTARFDGKSNNPEPYVRTVNGEAVDSTDLGPKKGQRQLLSLSKGFDNSSMNGASHSEAQLQSTLVHRGESQVEETANHENNKTKGSISPSTSRQVVAGSNQAVHCDRCNETGHATHLCSIDTLRLSALSPSGERIMREGNYGADLSCFPRKLASLEQSDVIGNLRCTTIDHDEILATIDVKQHVREATPSEELSEKTSTLNIYSQLGNPLRSSVFPEFEFVWQGGFQITTGKTSGFFDGFQAHLSNCASSKVLDVVVKFPSNINLEEVSRHSLWPSQFESIGPKEDNIALFFFSRDIISYEKTYKKLLHNIIDMDSALKGNIDGGKSGNLFETAEAERDLHPSSLDMVSVAQVASPLNGVKASVLKEELHGKQANESHLSNRSQQSTYIDLGAQDLFLAPAVPSQVAAVNKHPSDDPSCCYFTHSLEGKAQSCGLLGNHLEADLSLNSAPLCLEKILDAIHPRGIRSNPAFGIVDGAHPASMPDNLSCRELLLCHVPPLHCASETSVPSEAASREIEFDQLSLESRSSRKWSHSASQDTKSEVCVETPRSIGDTILRGENTCCGSSSNSREEKMSYRLSPEAHPVLPGFLYEDSRRKGVHGDDVKAHEDASFMSEDEGRTESDMPNLDLVLGCGRKSSTKELMPFLFPSVVRNAAHGKLPAGAVDDASVSLSLSLGFCDPEKDEAGGY